MDKATRVSATEFARNFGRYRDRAMTGEVIEVTSHGRVVGGFLSPDEIAHFERLKRREREVFRVGDLPDDLEADIAAADYGKPA